MTKTVDELIAGFATWRETRKVTTKFQCSMAALILVSACPSSIMAQSGHSHTQAPQRQEMAPGQKANANTLLRIVRDATERYQDVAVAEADGYALQFGCVSGPDDGAMGLHYVNGALVNSGVIDATKPQIIIYEPMPDGSRRLIGADFLVIADQWNATHSGPPELMGQLFHLFESPNRFGLPAFYTLHVWAWKESSKGAFVNWHPDVSCDAYAPANR